MSSYRNLTFAVSTIGSLVDCCYAIAVVTAAVARLDQIDDEEQQLIVELEELSLAGSDAPASDGSATESQCDGADDESVHREDAPADENSLDGLRQMGRWLHQFEFLRILLITSQAKLSGAMRITITILR